MQNIKSAAKFLVIDVVGSLIYFIPWWYYRGALKIIKALTDQARDLIRTLNLKILARFLFIPMYGLTDIWSRVISFPVRVVHFFILATIALVYMSILIALLLLWLLAPIFIVYNILYQLGLMPFNIYEYLWE